MLEIGACKTDITVWEPGLGMMGWGMVENRCESVATPLSARAYVLRDPDADTRIALVCVELCFVSIALRQRVCEILRTERPDLELDLHNVMMMATHTHSGPGGFTHYPFYNVTIPGFAPTVLEGLARRIADAIVEADAAAVPGQVRYGEGAFDDDLEVAFNRSVPSYNRNAGVDSVDPDRPHLALDRTMRMLRFDTVDGRLIGSINFFAVHCTSVHSDNTAIHFDNKGYAAQFTEHDLMDGDEDAPVTAFAQGATGDVTPNFRRHPGRPFMRGKYADDDKSARFNGRLQADQALDVLEQAGHAAPEPASLAFAHTFVDFSNVKIDPEFVGGQTGLHTAPAEIGMAMFFGTEEGPGLPRQLRFLQGWASKARRYVGRSARDRGIERAQAEKIPWVQSGQRRLLGMQRLRRLPLPWNMTEQLRLVRQLDTDHPDPKPWTPNVLPVQLFKIGDVAIAAVPGEFTTVAGARVRQTVARALGCEHVILAGYANAYAGYVTTPEEYEVQDYEGASTHFGKWTLPAWQMQFDRLARRMLDEKAEPEADEPRPPVFTPEELAPVTFRVPGGASASGV